MAVSPRWGWVSLSVEFQGLSPLALVCRPVGAVVHRSRLIGFLIIAFASLAGCSGDRALIDRALRRDRPASSQKVNAGAEYLVYCPDILELTVPNRPGLHGRRAIGADGRIDLGVHGRLRVEGLTVNEVADAIAVVIGLREDQVSVSVAEYKSQQIYLFGQVAGLQRAVAYQGPEPVVELLQRVGGITKGAAPGSIYVVRPGVIGGQEPQVFHIDLRGSLLGKDQRTNIAVQPFDQVFVGETRPISLEKCIPPILRPLYEMICGMRWPGSQKAGQGDKARGRQGDTERRRHGEDGDRETLKPD
jgi:protein involved in polysaccharide export with SLBB domain